MASSFWVVGVGSSAGGLEALITFVSNLPKDSPATYIFAQHLPPHQSSMMAELLSRDSRLPVREAKPRDELKPGHILIIPPNFDGEAQDGHLILFPTEEQTRPKPSVNRLFFSLATSYGTRAAGIIMSGTGSDGAEGIVAIKRAGGITFAQDLFTARFAGMPESAQETGKVDYILSPREMILQRPAIFGRFEADAKKSVF